MADDGKRLNGEGLAQVWESMQSYVQDCIHGSGTVKSITAGAGLSGGTITESGTIAVKPATSQEIGGVKVYYDSETESLYINTNDYSKVSKAVNLYDYDGTLLYSYDKMEFASLENLPQNPTHEGLIGQGWNWTLADAKEHMTTHDYLDIGQNYITDDGKTRIYIDLTSNMLDMNLVLYCYEDNTQLEINWGDNTSVVTFLSENCPSNQNISHTYAASGDYVITIEVKNNKNIAFVGYDIESESAADSAARRSKILWGPVSYYSEYLNAISKIEIGNNVSEIKTCGLASLRNLETITIPNSVLSIGAAAFNNDTNLKAVIFPKNLTDHTIPDECFVKCLNFEKAVLPNGITTVGTNAFYIDPKLERLIIPDGCEFFSGWAINYCKGLKILSLPVTSSPLYLAPIVYTGLSNIEYLNLDQIYIEEIPNNGLSSISLKSIELPSSCTEIGEDGISNCPNLESIVLPASVTTLGEYAFAQNFLLKNFSFSRTSPRAIPDYCFWQDFSLEQICLPRYLQTIGEYAFASCTALRHINLESAYTLTIGDYAFQNCTNLAYVKMPYNITAIPMGCFQSAATLKVIDFSEFGGSSVPTLAADAFDFVMENFKIIVPDEKYNDWIVATNWSDYALNIVKASEYTYEEPPYLEWPPA